MVPEKVERITVLGAGVMGHTIAQVAATAGFEVTVRDIAQEYIDNAKSRVEKNLMRNVERGRMTEEAAKGTLSRLSYTVDLADSVRDSDLVIEAIPENLDLKKRVWAEVSGLVKEDVILATNTSSLSITRIAEAVNKPERFIGMHFFNPPTHMRLVELIPGEATDPATLEEVRTVVERLGKTPVVVEKDVVGFIVNRVLITYLNEATKLVESGEYTIEQVDAAMQHSAKMPLGPFMLSDLIGIDIVHHILRVFEENLDAAYKPADSIVALFEAKKLGRKTGEGFYSYAEKPSVDEAMGEGFDVDLLLDVLIKEAENVVSEGIAGREAINTAMKLGANLPKGPFELKEGS